MGISAFNISSRKILLSSHSRLGMGQLPCTQAQGRGFAHPPSGGCFGGGVDSDMWACLKGRAAQVGAGGSSADKATDGGLTTFMRKLRAAWQIFFPPAPKSVSPKEEGKNRLRMILVADR